MNTSSHPFIHRQARFRFYAELNDYLPPDQRFKPTVYGFIGTPSVKDMIEAQQVPHTEVDLILVNGSSVNFAHRLNGEEEISVYPIFERLDLQGLQRLRPKPLRKIRFIADVHLGKLARYLRILGFDTLYRNDYSDHEIVNIALKQHRIILTRDLGILKYHQVTHSYWPRNTQPRLQLKELIEALQLDTKYQNRESAGISPANSSNHSPVAVRVMIGWCQYRLNRFATSCWSRPACTIPSFISAGVASRFTGKALITTG